MFQNLTGNIAIDECRLSRPLKGWLGNSVAASVIRVNKKGLHEVTASRGLNPKLHPVLQTACLPPRSSG